MVDPSLEPIGPGRGPNSPGSPHAEALPRPFALVVDDDEPARIVLGEILTAAGLDVVLAKDGIEALDSLREHPVPQVVLLDLLMPRMGGWRVLATMRESPRLAHVPVVVVTGCGERHYLPRGYPVLHKPIDAAVILSLVRELVEQKRLQDHALEDPPSDLMPRPSFPAPGSRRGTEGLAPSRRF